MKWSKRLAIGITVVMMIGWLQPLFTQPAFAATARIAKVMSVTGDVEVTKSGGKKPYKAFKNLYLNQGDHIKTGAKASLVLEVEDRKDEVTVGPNSSLYVSKLQEEEGKNTSFKVWSGSMWVSASKLLETEDSFEIETPTAVMGVRGTNFGVEVNEVASDITVASGIVAVQTMQTPPSAPPAPPVGAPTGNTGQSVTGQGQTLPSAPSGGSNLNVHLVYPTQTINVITDPQTSVQNVVMTVTPIQTLVQNNGGLFAQQILSNISTIQQENQQFIQGITQGTVTLPPSLSSGQGLTNLQNNVNNYGNVVANQALQKGIITSTQLQQIQSQQGVALNPSGPSTLLQTPEQQQAAQQAQQKKQQLEQNLNEQRERQQQQFTNVLQQIQNAMNQLNQQNNQQLANKSNQAREAYLAGLTEEQRNQFLLRERSTRQNGNAPATPPPPSGGSNGGGNPPLLTPPSLHADSSEAYVGNDIQLGFTDQATWRAAITGFTVKQMDSSASAAVFAKDRLSIGAGVLTVKSSEYGTIFPSAAAYEITIKATGYADASVVQSISHVPTPVEPVGVTHIGSSVVRPGDEVMVHLSQPGKLFLLDEMYVYEDIVFTEEFLLAQADQSFETEFTEGLHPVTLDPEITGSYVWVLLNPDTSQYGHSNALYIEPEAIYDEITGTVQLPAATEDGTVVLVYALDAEDDNSSPPPVPEHGPVVSELQYYDAVWVEGGTSSAEFSIPVIEEHDYELGYMLIPVFDTQDWVMNGFYLSDESTVYQQRQAAEIAAGSSGMVLKVTTGNTISGTILLPHRDFPGTYPLLLMAWSSSGGLGYQQILAEADQIYNYKLVLPKQTNYKLMVMSPREMYYNDVNQSATYYYRDTGLVTSSYAASSLNLTEQSLNIDVSIPMPEYGVTSVTASKFHSIKPSEVDPLTTGMYVEWDPYTDFGTVEYNIYVVDALTGDEYLGQYDDSEDVITSEHKFRRYVDGLYDPAADDYVQLIPGRTYLIVVEEVMIYSEVYEYRWELGVHKVLFDGHKPVLTSASPEFGEHGVSTLTTSLELLFNESIDVDYSRITIKNSSNEDISYSAHAENGFRYYQLMLDEPLISNERYTVSLAEGAATAGGIRNEPDSFSFLTELSVTGAVYGNFAYVRWGDLPEYDMYHMENNLGDIYSGYTGTYRLYKDSVDMPSDLSVYMEGRDADGRILNIGTWTNPLTMGTVTGITTDLDIVNEELSLSWNSVALTGKYHVLLIDDSGSPEYVTETSATSLSDIVLNLSNYGNYMDIMILHENEDGHIDAVSMANINLSV